MCMVGGGDLRFYFYLWFRHAFLDIAHGLTQSRPHSQLLHHLYIPASTVKTKTTPHHRTSPGRERRYHHRALGSKGREQWTGLCRLLGRRTTIEVHRGRSIELLHHGRAQQQAIHRACNPMILHMHLDNPPLKKKQQLILIREACPCRYPL
jgi:hypothetical protein